MWKMLFTNSSGKKYFFSTICTLSSIGFSAIVSNQITICLSIEYIEKVFDI
ncbi:hypothetical protein BPUM_2303 [Bacillus pumilus SAFR-032]|uniref:Uncharacterized protein n=1 Tax=Bacillus pumilus (strain SAFR-032) TaxID=315750 RepID=A8FFF5_BACP2|nr:hypothetical protein BPUM_2303 [Bacillus pumilus SAFR-032]